jgi:hypothetical protein
MACEARGGSPWVGGRWLWSKTQLAGFRRFSVRSTGVFSWARPTKTTPSGAVNLVHEGVQRRHGRLADPISAEEANGWLPVMTEEPRHPALVLQPGDVRVEVQAIGDRPW